MKAQKLLKVAQKVLDMAAAVEIQSSRFKRTMGEAQDFYLVKCKPPIDTQCVSIVLSLTNVLHAVFSPDHIHKIIVMVSP